MDYIGLVFFWFFVCLDVLVSFIMRVLVLPCCNQDFLNDRLQEGFLKRIRYSMKPDEAYGLVFSWDNVVVNSMFL